MLPKNAWRFELSVHKNFGHTLWGTRVPKFLYLTAAKCQRHAARAKAAARGGCRQGGRQDGEKNESEEVPLSRKTITIIA